jgi:hypothetical protein
VTRQPVSRLGRQLDGVSLTLVAIGALLFAYAFVGMRELRDQRDVAFVRGETELYSALNRHRRLQRLSWLGMGLAVTGIGVGLSAAVYNRKIANSETSDPSLRSG